MPLFLQPSASEELIPLVQAIAAALRGQECFLATPPWKAVMMEHYDSSIPLEEHKLLEELVADHMDRASILREAYRLKEVVLKMQAEYWSEVIAFLEIVNKKLHALDDWYQRWVRVVGLPSEKRSSNQDSPYPIIYTYPNTSIASTFCSHYVYKIIIHSILNATHVPGEHGAFVSYYVDQVCKSVEYNGHGLFGPYRMANAMTVAFAAGNLEQRKFINFYIERFSSVYQSIPRLDVHSTGGRPHRDVNSAEGEDLVIQ